LRHFVQVFGAAQPVLGLLPERADRRFDPSRGIEDLAEPMLATIRATQAHGPYILGGFSLGGLIAYEIAGRLSADGEEVAWLGILDSAVGQGGYELYLWPHTVRGFMTRLLQIGPRRAVRVAMDRIWHAIESPFSRLLRRPPPLVDYDFDYRGAARLGASYAPRGHSVSMDLFTSDESIHEAGDETLGWRRIHRGPLVVHPFPGKHFALVNGPSLRAVAANLSTRLGADDDASAATLR
jgi:thioesterase domain-containing protein